ncbi:MAG TPA: 2Fe-2S iron-sulfur cluster-binding protein, partial [Polyangiaceae bacterium]|nr:2Fe-2S iron-sulfur cluster-binding protein [Polyangiaceae bacterium]
MPVYQLSINGQAHEVDAPEDMPLLWVLRDIVNLTGTKYGCGIGQCRACTVHIDGAPTFSCQVRVGTLGSAEVVTIEGLSSERKEPLVAAWEAEDVPQCGYCQ